MTITLVSTTGSASDTNAAAEMYDTLVQPAQDPPGAAADEGGEGHAASISESADGRVVGTGTKEECEEVAADLQEQREQRAEEYLGRPIGKTRQKLMRRLSRLHLENESLQERLNEAERKLLRGELLSPQQNGNGQPSPAEQPLPQSQEQLEMEAARIEGEIVQRHKLQEMFADYNRQVEVARAAHDDFDKVVNTSAQVPTIAINAMFEMENGAEVAYYLAKHPEVRAELLKWNEPGVKGGVRKMLATLDHISESLNGGGHSQRGERPKRVSSAPPPISPVGTSGGSAVDRDPSKMPYSDYVKWYRQRYEKR